MNLTLPPSHFRFQPKTKFAASMTPPVAINPPMAEPIDEHGGIPHISNGVHRGEIWASAARILNEEAGPARATFHQRTEAGLKLSGTLELITDIPVFCQTTETNPVITILWTPPQSGIALDALNAKTETLRDVAKGLGATESGARLFYQNPDAGVDAPVFEVQIKANTFVKPY